MWDTAAYERLAASAVAAVARYVDLKREEWEEYRVQVSRWELDRYLPTL